MQTSSSSNESRNNDSSQKFSKVVASYSSCALAQKPIFPGDRKTKKNKENNQKSEKTMITSVTSSGKSSTSPLSEGEGKVSLTSSTKVGIVRKSLRLN